MISEWLLLAYGFGGGIVALVLPKICLCCCGFTCPGVRKHSVASRIHSNIGDVEAGSLFARSQSSGAVGFPWYINLMFFLFGFTTTVVIVLVEMMGGFDGNLKNETIDGNFETTKSMHLFNFTTVLPSM
ncbi:uncharacterized protein LOC129981877 [Argiope bruennichi]|uniref:uncharacterized protein LOC129981877 n=1 Tax=Argiope bruennichi TaxID=94029 RepID=UPI0024947508|nr:uncharacterized protein LOC129981877 [Argiope bruennichi]